MKAILFDADGVLFDATELHRVTFQAALEEYGYTITEEEHRQIFNGLPTRVKLNIVSEMKGLPMHLHEQIETRKQQMTLEMIPKTIKPTKGMGAALQRLRDLEIALVICSNARLRSVREMAKYAQIEHLFHRIMGNESVLRNKPYPDIYLLAAKQIGTPIEQCVIVEDSPKGMVAAISSGPGKIIKVSSPEDTVKKLEELL